MSLLISFFVGCSSNLGYESPPEYDLNNPEKFEMPESLREISGIAFHQGNPDTLYAQEDENGKLFYFKLGDRKISYSKFGKQGDYEDVAICSDEVIILRSDGVLFTFPFSEARKEETQNVHEWKNILPRGEYEALYADNTTNQLYVLCKQCKGDRKSNTGYIFKLTQNNSISPVDTFSISVREIERITGDERIDFNPSGFTKNSKKDEWYIISAVNKLLVVTNEKWRVKEVYTLNPEIFLQPEGIAFDADNNLYICNEGGDTKSAEVLKFAFSK